MTHRKIEEIANDALLMAEAKKAIDEEKVEKLAKAKEQIDAEYADRLLAIRNAAGSLSKELEAAKIAAATHPLEGQMVYKEEIKQDRYYSIRSRDKVVKLRGIVTVIRDYNDFPQRKINDRFARMPEFGDVIIQRVDAKGNKLKSWAKIYTGDILPKGWAIEEESVG